MGYKNKTTGNILSNSSTANARAWVQFVSAGLDSSGVIKTADTGQINTSTFTPTASLNTPHGYEIRRFNDTLQGTVPVFMKLEYGSGSAVNNIGLWLTVGKGSNGSGTITDIIFPRVQIIVAEVAAATAQFRISGDTNRFTFGLNLLNNNGGIIGIERSKDSAIVDNSDGVLVVQTTTGVGSFAFCPFSGTLPTVEATGNCLIPTSGTTSAGSNVGIFPPVFFWFGYNVYPGLNFYGYRITEILTDTEISATIAGTTREYATTGQFSAVLFAVNRNSNALMMRYES